MGGAELEQRASDAFAWGDFKALEQLYLQALGWRMDDGSAAARRVRDGISRWSDVSDADPRYLMEVFAQTRAWVEEFPQSPLAHAVHVGTMVDIAWVHRGSGYARTVTPEGWRLLREWLEAAQRHMATHAPVIRRDPWYGALMLSIGRGLGWTDAAMQAAFEQAAQAHPHEDATYFSALRNQLPKWGGDAAELHRYVQQVVRMTSAHWGTSWYARLYGEAADEEFSHSLFEDSLARWPELQAAQREMISRFPSRSRWSKLAYFACLAKDVAVLREALEQAGPQPDVDAFGDNARRTLEACQRLAQAAVR
jgi:hypothetical protein